MDDPPQLVVARVYMTHKGFPDLEPFRTIRLDGRYCWYFYYRLPEGVLELEVLWDVDRQDWFRQVTAFPADVDDTGGR
jgi:hypothetical protein